MEFFLAMTSDSSSFPDAAPAAPPSAGLLALGYRTQGLEEPDDAGGMATTGQVIDRYELIHPLGEGGFGVVWLARQYRPIQRDVALKLIRPGLDSREVITRFEAERQALALMDHPNIAGVLDAGATRQGQPYFVMELVDGLTITGHCDTHQLSLRERVELFIPVCQAVQHAHQKAVLHRDLKPSNILITEIDGQPLPKVIDFGIAKALGPAAESLTPDHPGRTRLGTVVGTPQYMSPEQAGSGLDVDTRSDVYSLGVVLCELLTGRTPLPAATVDFAAAVRLICDSESVRPSVLVGSDPSHAILSAQNRKLDPARLVRGLRGDLDWITLKALEKDRTRRYETATALARDLQRYLEGKTVSAAAPTWPYQLGKFTRRHKVGLGAAVLVIAAMAGGTTISLWQASRAERSRAEAELNYARARGAVEKYLNSVTDHPRLQQADFRDLQQTLLETALPFYQELSQAKGDDARLSGDRADALGRLADLYQGMAKHEKAETAYLQALDLGHQLAREDPEDPVWRKALAMRYHNFAILKKTQKKWEEALGHYNTAVELISGLAATYPDIPEHAYRYGVFRLHRGQLLDQLGRKKEAERDFLAVLNDQAGLAAKFPHESSFREQKGICHTALGNLYSFQSKFPEAEQAYRVAISVYEEALRKNPQDKDCRRVLAATYSNRGNTLHRAGDKSGAVENTRRAAEIYRKLADEFPTYNELRSAVVRCHLALSDHYEECGMKTEFLAALNEALSGQQQLAAAVPHSLTYPKGLAAILARLAGEARSRNATSQALDYYRRAAESHPSGDYQKMVWSLAMETGNHATAADAAVAWAEAVPSGWEVREQAAGMLLKAIRAAKENASFHHPERTTWMETRLAQAVGLLRQAVDQGFACLPCLDHAELLLRRADFKALLDAPPPSPPEGMAGRFGLEYNAGDDPGIRQWVHDGMRWTETQPSGIRHFFAVAGPIVANGVRGVEIRRDGKTELVLFVPNVGATDSPRLLLKKPDGTWSSIGAMVGIE